jgi:hypothetical protein
MSTKATIAGGPTFFYEELCDKENVYLELESTNYSASFGRVMVQIPLHVWEVIRQHTLARYELVDLTDDEIEARTVAQVDEGITGYQAAKAEDPDSMIAKIESIHWNKPKEKLLKEWREHYYQERKFQRELRDAVNRLKEKR